MQSLSQNKSINKTVATGKKISKSLLRYHLTGKTQNERDISKK
jgi:hypothetical protein